MEENNTSIKSIWGAWWTSFRKWFYSAWLVYETSIRFFEYALDVYQYFIIRELNLGENTVQILAVLCSSLTFLICFFYLTVPATLALYRYFKPETLSKNPIEEKFKTYF